MHYFITGYKKIPKIHESMQLKYVFKKQILMAVLQN